MQRFLIYLYLQKLYTIQAVPSSIIRSTQLYIQLQVLSTITATIVDEMELTFHLIHDSSEQQCWLTVPEAICSLQLCAPDDGRRNRLKHVERL